MAAKPKLPAELAQEIATTGDGRDITRPWVEELEQPRDRRLFGAVDWGIYDRIRRDDQVKSCMEQRIRAVVSRNWEVLPGDDTDPRSVEAADRFADQLKAVSWDRVTEKMLWATFYGYAVAEPLWEVRGGQLRWKQIKVRHARRFRYDQQGRLRLLTRASPRGELLPERAFWVVTSGGTDDDTPYGEGLADWLYWPTLFKRNGVRFWNIFLDKFSVPTAMGTYPRGTSAADIGKFLQTIMAIATDSGFVVPEGMDVKLLELAQSGANFETLCRYMDGAIAKIILSQTMTTDDGASRAQGEVHADVKLEIVKADADLLSDSFNAGPARWWTDFNYGADVASPVVRRVVEEEDDLAHAAATDEALDRLGWRRTEESFKERFGDGYEPAPAKAPPAAPAAPDRAPDAVDEDFDRLVNEPARIALAEAVEAALRPRDIVDDAVDAAMADDGWRTTIGAMLDPLLARLQAAGSIDEALAIIAREAELADDRPLTEALARAQFATRIDALTDQDADG